MLPIRSTGRFMCVSKELRLFLISETFKKLHICHDKFLILINDYKEPRTLVTIDCEAPNDVFTFKLPVEFKGVCFLTSLDGLVCVSIDSTKQYRDLVLWNPLTNDRKISSKLPTNHYLGSLGLVYSSCEDDYKLVSLSWIDNVVDIYSLKSDSWKTVAFKGVSKLSFYRLSGQGICLNENLYFLDGKKKYSVVRFNTKTHTFTKMNTSDLTDDIDHYSAILMVKNGSIHVCVTYESYVGKVCFEIEFWKIDEDGNWKNIETYKVDTGYMRFMKPLHLMRTGNLLMLGTKYKKLSPRDKSMGDVYNVDLKKKHSKRKGKDKETRCSENEISDIVRYTETTVSPNQYIK